MISAVPMIKKTIASQIINMNQVVRFNIILNAGCDLC